MHLKPLPKFLLLATVVGGSLLGYRHLVMTGTIRRSSILKTVIPLKADDINASILPASTGIKILPLPSKTPMESCVDGNTSNCLPGATQEIEEWFWNAGMAVNYAVGGLRTTKGSLTASHGVSVSLRREDDSNNMQRDLLDSTTRMMSNPDAPGPKFVIIMGDGSPQFFKQLNPKLAKICSDCTAKVIAEVGYSRGEDQFLGPQKWKDDCQAMRGGMTIGVPRDGDWDIAVKKLNQCQIPNNPDNETYDPTAMNWIFADTYTQAAEMFVSGACVDLPTKGKLTGGKQRHCADGVVTWTPGDVTVAQGKGGVVTIASTQQFVFQMPAVLIGIDHWMKAHRSEVNNMLSAFMEAADQVRSNSAALRAAAEASAVIYAAGKPVGSENADYILKYYHGVTEPDKTGVPIHLGGSAVSNLSDNLQAFGLNGGPSLFAATYTTFGKIDVQQYPRFMPDFIPVSDISDMSYLSSIRGSLPENNGEQLIKTDLSVGIHTVEGKKNYSIQFATGSADILPQSHEELDQLAADISLTNYKVALNGFTDNAKWAGLNEQSFSRNQQLSEARANSVRAYLVGKGIRNAIRTHGYGEDNPIASNDTAAGRALNRRVQVVVGE